MSTPQSDQLMGPTLKFSQTFPIVIEIWHGFTRCMPWRYGMVSRLKYYPYYTHIREWFVIGWPISGIWSIALMRKKSKIRSNNWGILCNFLSTCLSSISMFWKTFDIVHKYLSRLGHENGSKKTCLCKNWEGKGDQREYQLDIGTWQV